MLGTQNQPFRYEILANQEDEPEINDEIVQKNLEGINGLEIRPLTITSNLIEKPQYESKPLSLISIIRH